MNVLAQKEEYQDEIDLVIAYHDGDVPASLCRWALLVAGSRRFS